MISIRFTKMIRDSAECGSTDEYMVSRLVFDVSVDAELRASSAFVDLKQRVGSSWADALEVGPPTGYSGPFNDGAFRRAAERVYRDFIRLLPGGTGHVRMTNNVIAMNETVSFEVDRPPPET
jgi:hypothetical protein